MQQLLILSGKGGTGKTTVAGAFIKLSGAKAVADCDVEAPNLHLLMECSEQPLCHDYFGMPKAVIDPEKCILCGACYDHCRFDAIVKGDSYTVNSYNCEGCGVCKIVCSVQAVSFQPAAAGRLSLFLGNRVFSTAQLYIGNGTSGKLVTEVKKQLTKHINNSIPLAIIDGSPGIGCPVIASLSGADMVLIVAEPSVSGISDMKRIIQTAKLFHRPIAVCINKYDMNKEKSKEIEIFCRLNYIPFVGRMPYDKEAVIATNSGLSIIDIDCPSGRAVQLVFKETIKLLFAADLT